ncbi:flagellar biosynthesis anti-sigma factor FlgM [Mariprofundus ferrooxydans]|uniref:flagellar biosynthesis anti-sigma factor FlgM n=1 Tax=Mariprofundus ferrooxydans TaxID=314344 RepID=UPI0003667108|nr:flagellar biosynthesis anti-sigma factor FlgM [Mariprofundus ferrooxydans]
MRVNNSGAATGIHKSSGTGKAKDKATASTGKSRDSVQVTDSASLREKAQVMLADMSPVRMERIEEIRDALENGTYPQDSHKVATQIVANALAEHPWS